MHDTVKNRMSQDFFAILQDLSSRGEAFAVATVIEVEGSSSAKPGSKAIIDANAAIVLGWVGGGCIESAVREEALASLKDGKTRVITLDLNDEIFGLGMPCGGSMRVYIEPVLPKPELVIVGHGRIAEVLAELGHLVGFTVTVVDPGATPEAFPQSDRLFASSFGTSDVKVGVNSYVVVATQHKGDHLSIKKALDNQARYIALIASHGRAQLVFDYLEATGVPRAELDLARVRAPAGLDIGAQTPEEVAVSIISEMIAVRRKAAGQLTGGSHSSGGSGGSGGSGFSGGR